MTILKILCGKKYTCIFSISMKKIKQKKKELEFNPFFHSGLYHLSPIKFNIFVCKSFQVLHETLPLLKEFNISFKCTLYENI